jgi:hypothetical protein
MKKLPFIASILISLSLLAGFQLSQSSNQHEKIFLRHVDECLSLIEKEAQKIPMQGVAMVAYIPGDQTKTWTSKMKVVGKLADDKVNLLAIVYAKASEMAVTMKDSGEESRKDIVGELGYRGGTIMKIDSGYLVAAFSGGTSDDDLAVAQKGLQWLAKKF